MDTIKWNIDTYIKYRVNYAVLQLGTELNASFKKEGKEKLINKLVKLLKEEYKDIANFEDYNPKFFYSITDNNISVSPFVYKNRFEKYDSIKGRNDLHINILGNERYIDKITYDKERNEIVLTLGENNSEIEFPDIESSDINIFVEDKDKCPFSFYLADVSSDGTMEIGYPIWN